MKKAIASIIISLLLVPLFAEPQAKDLYAGKWVNGDTSIEITAGTTGYVLKYTKPQQAQMPLAQGQAPAANAVELYGSAYVNDEVLFMALSNATYFAIITKDDQLLIGGTFFKHEG